VASVTVLVEIASVDLLMIFSQKKSLSNRIENYLNRRSGKTPDYTTPQKEFLGKYLEWIVHFKVESKMFKNY
jgi:hypothetical protein